MVIKLKTFQRMNAGNSEKELRLCICFLETLPFLMKFGVSICKIITFLHTGIIEMYAFVSCLVSHWKAYAMFF